MFLPGAVRCARAFSSQQRIVAMKKGSWLSRVKRRWSEFWGLVFFLGVLINFMEIICRSVFHFSLDLMYDIPIWLTIWAVMMLAGPILPDGDHVSVDMVRDHLHGLPRKCCEIINCLATIAFGGIITWGGAAFIMQCYEFKMNIIRCISVPRWLVEICVPIGMFFFTIFAVYQLLIILRTEYPKKDMSSDK